MKQFGWQVIGCSMPAMQRQERHGHQELTGPCNSTRTVAAAAATTTITTVDFVLFNLVPMFPPLRESCITRFHSHGTTSTYASIPPDSRGIAVFPSPSCLALRS